jgi:sugar lactone lactonase YvrE
MVCTCSIYWSFVFTLCFYCYVNCELYKIETFAGSNSTSGGFSGDGGTATSAQLSRPNANWINSLGVLYIGDRGNNRVRLINTQSIISTFAGGGLVSTQTETFPITPATAAALRPFGICGDTLGTIYVVENPTEVIRKVDYITKQISLFAGNGKASVNTTNENGDGGQATSATFYYASYCAVDSSGSVFVSSANEYKVKRVSVPNGIIQTVAGTGVYATTGDGGHATSAALKLPYSLFMDTRANLFVSLYNGRQVRVILFGGGTNSVITNFAGGVHDTYLNIPFNNHPF